MWSFQVKIKSDKEIFTESPNQKPLDESQALVILKQGDGKKKKPKPKPQAGKWTKKNPQPQGVKRNNQQGNNMGRTNRTQRQVQRKNGGM
jgi:hypothetical protein